MSGVARERAGTACGRDGKVGTWEERKEGSYVGRSERGGKGGSNGGNKGEVMGGFRKEGKEEGRGDEYVREMA